MTLGYDDTCESGLPVVVFLHGLSMSRATWGRFLPELEGRCRVVRLDQRGHGDSSHAPGTYQLDSYVADTVGFLEDVVGEPSLLAGHSLGGVIAHAVAQRRPDVVLSAFLEDPPLYVAERIAAGPDRAEASRVASMFPVLQQVARDMQAHNAPVADYEKMLQRAPALNGEGTLAEVIGPEGSHAMAEAFSQLDPDIFTPAIDGSGIRGADLSQPLSRPVVVLRADPALGPAFTEDDATRFLETNPHARIVVFEGASHAIHDEQPARFLDELLAVVRSQRPSAPAAS
jgi:pimeloyl-ACP methyl ester carboxylesterase